MLNWFKKTPAGNSKMLPSPKDDYDRAILGDIARVGWSVAQINPDRPGDQLLYNFSVGLFHTHGHPEIALMGLTHAAAGSIINSIGKYVALTKKKIEADRPYDSFTSVPVVFKPINPDHYREYFGYAIWLYGGLDFPMLQCVWPLKSGLFPWDKGYPPEGASVQPFLGRFN